MTEYRLEELAREANTTVRNIRAYRDRGLLPPPRRQGRVALYADAHLARLRLVADLVGRGYTLSSIGELLAAWERGKDISDVLGFEEVLTTPFSDEEVTVLTRAELEALMGSPMSDATIEATTFIGLIEPLAPDGDADVPGPADEGQRYRITSLKELNAGRELVRVGIPNEAVLGQGLRVYEALDVIAREFVELVSSHLYDPLGESTTSEDMARLADTVQRIRPLAADVVDAELARALERHVQEFVASRIGRMVPVPEHEVPTEAS